MLDSSQGPGGEPKKAEVMEENGEPEDGWVLPVPLFNTAEPPHSRRQDVHSTPEEFRSRFYEDYRKVAEEYDKEFDKRYDEDLNTTLIFVSLTSHSDVSVLIQITGWSILRCHVRLHHPGPSTTPV